MIIISGTGRSGTSFLGKLYVELGFSVAGADVWRPDGYAGVESPEVNELLAEIMQDLVVPLNSNKIFRLMFSFGKRVVGKKIANKSTRRALRFSPLRNQILLHNMEKFDEIVQKFSPRINELASRYEVIKAPGFCRTLGVWAAAGAQVDFVVITIREINKVIASQNRIGALRYTDSNMAYNHYASQLGYLLAAVADHNLKSELVHFPDFLEAPKTLYDQLVFPAPVSENNFLLAFKKVRALEPRNRIG